MIALLGYALISYAHNIVRASYSRKPVSYYKRRAPLKQFGQRFLYKQLGARINSACGFVQDYNFRISQDYTGKGQ